MSNVLIPIQEHEGKTAVSGRDLHAFLEVKTPYKDWFPRMVDYGFVDGQDFSSILSESSGGRPSMNHAMTLDMAKELSMIQRTDKGKQARQYFIEVEKRKSVAPTGPELLALAVVEAHQVIEAARNKVAELTPKAEAFDALLSTAGDYSVNEAAKVLARDHNIQIGEGRLRKKLEDWGWIYRHSGKPRAKQAQVDLGRMTEKARWHYHPETAEKVLDTPQVRLTAKGIDAIRKRMLAPLAVAA
ncbi:antA/AntB antirepressor family protein [Glutamicibacter sp. MCAF14]|uniref:antA/AntB antirepressor family protein n=1 Tax=Glutamicibacter sp. MCAF14 TaxID=3233043 RepID=UPI003F92CB81